MTDVVILVVTMRSKLGSSGMIKMYTVLGEAIVCYTSYRP